MKNYIIRQRWENYFRNDWKSLSKIDAKIKEYDSSKDVFRFFLEQKAERGVSLGKVRFSSVVEVIEYPLRKIKSSSKIEELSKIAFKLKRK